MVRPSASAVFKLMTNSNMVGCSMGKSAGLAPLRNPCPSRKPETPHRFEFFRFPPHASLADFSIFRHAIVRRFLIMLPVISALLALIAGLFRWFCQISRKQGQNRVFLHAQPTVFTRHTRGATVSPPTPKSQFGAKSDRTAPLTNYSVWLPKEHLPSLSSHSDQFCNTTLLTGLNR
jgi:hypothetical protein